MISIFYRELKDLTGKFLSLKSWQGYKISARKNCEYLNTVIYKYIYIQKINGRICFKTYFFISIYVMYFHERQEKVISHKIKLEILQTINFVYHN